MLTALGAAVALAGCSTTTDEVGSSGSLPEPARRSLCASSPALLAPPRARPRYSLRLHVKSERRLVVGRQEVRFTASRPTRRLVFRLWPNGPRHRAAGARLDVGTVTIDGERIADTQPNPTTLVVPLAPPLARGERVDVSLPWRLRMPGPVLDRISQRAQALRLGSFFPILSWDGSGWATDPPTTALGETSTSPTSDFTAVIRTPPGTRVIATGREVAPGTWRAETVRDFALAVGRFKVATAVARAPRRVRVTIGVAEQVAASARAFASKVVGALEDLSARFGPYPWPTLNLAVMPDLGRAGIEYPTMIFQGGASLNWATTHEVAHMWFYSLVGNNQARDPWLDESLASWAQARAEGLLPWFTGVQVPPDAAGRLGAPMVYWARHETTYFHGVYAQGVQALRSLGDPSKVDCALRLYAARNAYRTVGPGALLTALRRVIPGAARELARFGARG